MRKYVLIFSALALVVLFNACNTKKSKENNLSAEQSLYLGQKPPGLKPEPFAPGIVTTEGWEYCGGFTPDLKEFYYLREIGETKEDKKTEFVVIQNKDNQWKKTVISLRVGTPFISPDGKIMYLGKRYKERLDNGNWSEIKKLGFPFDSLPIMRLTASSKGTYFFDEFKSDFTGDIRYSRIVNGEREEPKLLSKKINGGKSFHPFIASDESYLIFDGKREGEWEDEKGCQAGDERVSVRCWSSGTLIHAPLSARRSWWRSTQVRAVERTGGRKGVASPNVKNKLTNKK